MAQRSYLLVCARISRARVIQVLQSLQVQYEKRGLFASNFRHPWPNSGSQFLRQSRARFVRSASFSLMHTGTPLSRTGAMCPHSSYVGSWTPHLQLDLLRQPVLIHRGNSVLSGPFVEERIPGRAGLVDDFSDWGVHVDVSPYAPRGNSAYGNVLQTEYVNFGTSELVAE